MLINKSELVIVKDKIKKDKLKITDLLGIDFRSNQGKKLRKSLNMSAVKIRKYLLEIQREKILSKSIKTTKASTKDNNKAKNTDRKRKKTKKEKHASIKIQALIKGYYTRRLNKLRGECLFKRSLSSNERDIMLYDNVNKIKFTEFISYKDNDYHYSFNVNSLNELIKMGNENPYNCNQFPQTLKNDCDQILKYLKIELETIQNFVIDF